MISIEYANHEFDEYLVKGTSFIDRLQAGTVPYSLVKYKANTLIDKNVSILLDETFTKVVSVPGLKTALYPHQQTAIAAMLELETHRTINLPHNGVYNTNQHYVVSYNSAVLSEPVGSGKTIDILALILLNKMPKVVADITTMSYPKCVNTTGYMRRKFTKILKPTVIFVGSSVIKQWESAIKEFTDLTVFVVDGINKLEQLLLMIESREINKYKIVLIKNGHVSRAVDLIDDILLEPKNDTKSPYIYNILANLRPYCWKRVVIDDFDTIKLPQNANIVNGLFTWYVSSTRKHMNKKKTKVKYYETASEILKHMDYGCAEIMYNHNLFYLFNVRNNPEFLQQTTQIPNPKYHVCMFRNPNDRFINLLDGIENDDIRRISEMLSADAINTAAELAGIKSTSVADIFEKILGDRFKKYRFAGDLLAFIEHLREEESNRLSMSRNPDEDDRYGKKDLLEFREIEYKYPGVNRIIDDTDIEYKEIYRINGLEINRVKDNINHGACPVCRVNLEDCSETVIAKCCDSVFCGSCGFKAQNMNTYKALVGRCASCRKTITIKDLIFIGDNFDLKKINNEEFDDEEEEVEVKADDNANLEPTKYTTIINIINGERIDNDVRVDMHIPNMMKGKLFLKEAAIRKVLIFANYDETLECVQKELTKNNIKYWRLKGSSNELHKTSSEFNSCETACALVINSTMHCSGLNLQTATDIVFTHQMSEVATVSQIVGRGQRIGRANPLNIWFMQYNTEYQTLAHMHYLRELNDQELQSERASERASGQ